MIGGVSLVVVALVLLGLTTQYTRRSTTLGYLRPDVGLVGVSSTRSGSLSIDVSNGDLVAQGQRLATIEGIGTSLDGTPFIDLELASLWDAINLIGERITLAQQQTIALNTQQDLAIKQHIRDIEAAIRLATTREEQTIFAAGQFVRTSDLFTDGVVASTAVDEAQQNLLAAEQEQENDKGPVFPKIETLRGKCAEGTHFTMVYPGFFLVNTLDSMWWINKIPISPEQSYVRSGFCFPRTTVARDDFEEVSKRYHSRWDLVVDEDNQITARHQKGIRSPFARPGRLSFHEEVVNAMNNWVLDKVLD